MSEEARVAYIDGVAVPRILARSQWEPLFPNLIRGVLREHRDGGAFICPDAEGTFILDGGKEYVIYFQSLGAGDVQSHMSDSNASYDSSRSHGPVTISSLAESNGLSATSTPGSGGSGSLTQKKALYMRPPTLRPLDNALTNTETVDVLPSQTAIKHCDAQGQESENPAHVRAGDDVGNISIAPYSRPPENNVDLLCGKYLQDRVHEYVFLPALAVKIMDTPEFQHLRSLKQLGPTDYIYPSTTHTRFEHSIGVAHLASELLVCIARRQPELKINKKDILSVVVAGLCHDLGHGPFSHLFENLVNRYRAKKGEKEVFSHENMSIRLLRRILSRISLDQFGLDEDDARFIELCIVGLSPGTPWPTNVGRSPEKRFLVDVIANKRNGVDMDRLDYFMRDSIACYGRAAFDVHIPRLFSASKVFCFEGEHQICFEEKTALSLVKMFTVRANLHKHVYQHRVVVVLCHMISDALLEAESHLSFRGSNNKTFTLAESVNDDEAYCKLGDWIVDFIAASTSKELEKARFIIDRIYKRDLYRVAGSAIFKEYRISRTKEDILNEMLEICERMYNNSVLRHQLQSLLIVDLIRISFGSEDINGKADNPVKKVTFFSPKNFSEGPFKLSEEHISPLFSPSQYGELSLVVIVRESAFLNEATAIFKKWKSENHKHLCVAVPVHNTRSEITSQNSPIRGSFGSTTKGSDYLLVPVLGIACTDTDANKCHFPGIMLSTTPSISVIYENDELVVINKPIDVPMDGEGYPLTVERWANAYRSLREAVKEDTTEQLGTGTLLCDPAISIGHPSVTTIHCRKRVKFVHQLDFATSGVLCVAFSKEMAARLSHCFEMRTARKAYLAVVCGTLFSACSHGQKFETCFLEPQIRSRVRLIALDELPDATFIQECIAKLTMDCSRTVTDADNSASLLLETQLIEVNIPVGHDSSDAQNFRMAIDGRGARESLTYIHVLKHGFMSHPLTSMPVAVTKVALFPRTGRRHQLRVHCRALGFPIVGDVTYGFTDGLSPCEALRSQEHFCQESVKTCAWPRMMLHAWRLSLPVSVEPLRDEKERYLQKRKRRRETLGLDGATQHGQDFLEWTHFITEDPFSLADLDKEMDNG